MENQTINIQFEKEMQEKAQTYYTLGRQAGRIGTYGATKEQRGEAIAQCTWYNDKAKEGGDYAPLYEAFVKGFSDAFYSMD